MNSIQTLFAASVEVKNILLEGKELDSLIRMGDVITESVKNGGKLLL